MVSENALQSQIGLMKKHFADQLQVKTGEVAEILRQKFNETVEAEVQVCIPFRDGSGNLMLMSSF